MNQDVRGERSSYVSVHYSLHLSLQASYSNVLRSVNRFIAALGNSFLGVPVLNVSLHAVVTNCPALDGSRLTFVRKKERVPPKYLILMVRRSNGGSSSEFNLVQIFLALHTEFAILLTVMCVSRSMNHNLIAASKRWCGDIAMFHGIMWLADWDNRS
jgi:hypothetical protein